jgi:voltage-gated potassium channel
MPREVTAGPSSSSRKPVTVPAVLASGERERRYAAVERALATPMLVLSLLIIPVLLVPLAWPSMPATGREVLTAIDAGTWVAFTAEYLVLLVLAPRRGLYIRTHLVELALVLLPMLRPLRVLRSVRLLRAVPAARAAAGAATAAKISRRRLASAAGLYAPAAAVLLVLMAAALMRDAERSAPGATIKSYDDAVWWAITTVTTVGYGDRYPVTATGRAIAAGLMIIGVALLGIVTASMAAAFTRWSAAEDAEIATEQADHVELADVMAELRALRAEVASLHARLAPDNVEVGAPSLSPVGVTGGQDGAEQAQ